MSKVWARRFTPITLLLIVFTGSLVYQAKHTGLTIDEPSHFAAAYAYWLGQDVLKPPDTPPLTRIICGWVPVMRHAPDPRQSIRWASRDAYLIGSEILGIRGHPGRAMLFYTRLPFIVFPLGISFLCWYWARVFLSETVALLLAACVALEPSLSAHGSLINSDVPAAFIALWFSYALWTFWRTPTTTRLMLLILTLLLALLTKFTLLPLLPIGFLVALYRRPRLSTAILIPAALYAGLLAACQFRAHPLSDPTVAQLEDTVIPHLFWPVARLAARLPWPPQFVDALFYIGILLHGKGFTGYMLGYKIEGWTPGYFPLAWILKFPIPLQLLTAVGFTELLRRIRRCEVQALDMVTWGIALMLFGLAVLSNYHIGFGMCCQCFR